MAHAGLKQQEALWLGAVGQSTYKKRPMSAEVRGATNLSLSFLPSHPVLS